MSIGNQELNILTENVIDFLKKQMIKKNQQDSLDEYLVDIGFKEKPTRYYETNKKTSKILIVGQTDLREDVIKAIFRENGISKDRLELIREYDKASKYNFSKLQWNTHYGAILFGPISHSGEVKGDASSTITKIENTEGYPSCKRLSANNDIKITKSNLRQAIEELIIEGIIYQDL